MDKNISKEEFEFTKIIKMLINGDTSAQIANEMNYSISTVSNRLNILFQKYNAKNRYEFVYNFFSKIIKKYKKELNLVNHENTRLKKQLSDIKNIILNTDNNNKKTLSHTILYDNAKKL